MAANRPFRFYFLFCSAQVRSENVRKTLTKLNRMVLISNRSESYYQSYIV